MKSCRSFAACGVVLLSLLVAGAGEERELPLQDKLQWIKGPTNVSLADIAEVNVPPGYAFLAAQDTRTLLEAFGNPTDGSELGMLAPEPTKWFVVFQFSDVGYVKDDDKDKLDADKMLSSIQAGNEEANQQRKKMGSAPLSITGWEQPPRYNELTHNLEWAIRGESEGDPVVNWNTRLLGRRGVMEVQLVVDPAELQATLPQYAEVLKSYSYKSGQSYAEYRQGDKVAKYGLAALVVGGAAVGAAKLGFFSALIPFLKKGWVLIVAAVAAVASWFRRLALGGRRKSTE